MVGTSWAAMVAMKALQEPGKKAEQALVKSRQA
jgi:hypothetical protein